MSARALREPRADRLHQNRSRRQPSCQISFLAIAAKSDPLMRAVAERLRAAGAAAAQRCLPDARDDAAGATRDLQIAAHAERTIGLRIDRELAVADREHVRVLRRRRLSGRRELDLVMRAVAERLRLRRAATAQRGAKALRVIELDLGVHGVRPVLADR